MTFNAEEMQEVLLTLQDKKDDPNATLYGVGITLLDFDLLRANEVRIIIVADVDLNHQKKEITVKFTHRQIQRNDGFTFNIPSIHFSMFKRYMGQICMN